MKNTKKIISISLCILTVSTVMAMFTACGKKDEPIEREPLITEETTENVSIEDPTIETTKKKTKTKTERETATTQRTVTETKKYEPTTSKQSVATKKPTSPSTTKKPEQITQRRETTTKKQEYTTKKQETTTTKNPEPTTKKPVTTTKSVTTTKAESVSKPYSCGSKNHHCTTKEEHAFIKSLEEKGCSICGSHSCRSFYAIDEWGNNCYDITKCPKYSEKKDPANYCEHCGKEIGLGDNGSCVRFTVDTKCPICGKKVPAKTCHTH